MNKGRNIAILMACLLVLSLLTLLTRSFGGNDTAVVDNVRYVRDSDALSTVTLYEFYFVGTEVMEGDLEQLDDGRYRFTLRYRIPIERSEDEIDIDQNDELPDYTLEPYGYTYYLTGDSEKTAEVTWEYAEGFGPEFGEQPWERFSPKVFKTMIFGRKPPLSIPQALLVAAIAAGGALIIFYAEELWHFFGRKGEDEIPEWHDMDKYKRIGGIVIAVAVLLLIVFIII